MVVVVTVVAVVTEVAVAVGRLLVELQSLKLHPPSRLFHPSCKHPCVS